MRNRKHEYGGQLKVNIRILFYGDSSRTVAIIRQMKFGKVKYLGHACKFYFESFNLTKILNMAMVRNSKVMLGQTLDRFV
jgi:hypothetical protein